ncbi:MAG: MltA domain-containing protein [Proteobacteria bacterium]|nr:MltA domain-containing protein [Pseudomonadota bacterium]
MPKTLRYLVCVIASGAILASFGCYPALREMPERPEQALVPVRFFYPKFDDDMDLSSLEEAVRRNLEYLERLKPDQVFYYGPHRYTRDVVVDSQKAFLELVSSAPDSAALNKEIRKRFLVYKATGRVGERHVLFTGYFEPVYEAKLAPDKTFKYPIYRKPDDLIKIDLSLFREEFKGKNVIARIDGKNVLPYFSRAQIAVGMALEGRNLEIAWLKDPLDVAFLHIQGSGRLVLGEGEGLGVGFAEKNGHPYRSIGRYLMEKGLLTREEISMQSIRGYLSENPAIIDEVLNYNPSFVFFRILGEAPLVGSINVPLTPGRTLALDSRLFPPGALAFIRTQKPIVDEKGEISGWKNFSRFVLNQDTGGAIRGAGRADLFWGRGPYAELAAGHMKHEGELYLLIKKPQR